MNYEHFEKLLTTEITEKFEEKYDIRICTVPKNNGIRKRAIVLHDHKGVPLPLQYLDEYYHMWKTGLSIRHVANLLIHDYNRNLFMRRSLPEHFFRNYEEVRQNLQCRLISAEKNKEFLREVPHQKWMDLAIICVYELHADDYSDCAIQIRNEHLALWDIDPEQIMKDAIKAAVRTDDILFEPLVRILEEELEEDDDLPDSPLYLLSNKNRVYGAVNIALPGVTERIAKKLAGDYFIIPSSIHECLILPDDGTYSAKELNKMVSSINQTNVAEQDVLSDHVYIYKRPENEILHF
ncbi:MAG: DUF5688 family protein [Bilifractor sp.]